MLISGSSQSQHITNNSAHQPLCHCPRPRVQAGCGVDGDVCSQDEPTKLECAEHAGPIWPWLLLAGFAVVVLLPLLWLISRRCACKDTKSSSTAPLQPTSRSSEYAQLEWPTQRFYDMATTEPLPTTVPPGPPSRGGSPSHSGQPRPPSRGGSPVHSRQLRPPSRGGSPVHSGQQPRAETAVAMHTAPPQLELPVIRKTVPPGPPSRGESPSHAEQPTLGEPQASGNIEESEHYQSCKGTTSMLIRQRRTPSIVAELWQPMRGARRTCLRI